jgi:hypothetical protein
MAIHFDQSGKVITAPWKVKPRSYAREADAGLLQRLGVVAKRCRRCKGPYLAKREDAGFCKPCEGLPPVVRTHEPSATFEPVGKVEAFEGTTVETVDGPEWEDLGPMGETFR